MFALMRQNRIEHKTLTDRQLLRSGSVSICTDVHNEQGDTWPKKKEHHKQLHAAKGLDNRMESKPRVWNCDPGPKVCSNERITEREPGPLARL
jgi:hypothetical protein